MQQGPMGNEQDLESDDDLSLVPNSDMQMQQNDNGKSSKESEFDTNFDAGVEADEDEDPKKYIQQLTGKLSQTLGTYNNEKGEPDTELGKYVAGMIVKQAVKGMDEKDKKEIIKKINMTADDSDKSTDDEDLDSDENNDLELPDDEPKEKEQQKESVKINCGSLKKLLESFDSAKNIFDVKKKENLKKKSKKLNSPFEAPKFEK